MKKKRVQIGDVVLIPAKDNYVPGKVVYVSKYFKNVILLGLYRKLIKGKIMPKTLPGAFFKLVYTSQEPILKGRWEVVGNESPMLSQAGLTKRIVGGEVWIDDECIAPATDADFKSLPKMSVWGAGLVEDEVAELL
jgi:hypothetical protein